MTARAAVYIFHIAFAEDEFIWSFKLNYIAPGIPMRDFKRANLYIWFKRIVIVHLI